jgi:hypothetical protein
MVAQSLLDKDPDNSERIALCLIGFGAALFFVSFCVLVWIVTLALEVMP